jgi:hypothetical protein
MIAPEASAIAAMGRGDAPAAAMIEAGFPQDEAESGGIGPESDANKPAPELSPRKSWDWTGAEIDRAGIREIEAIDPLVEPDSGRIEPELAVVGRECQEIGPEQEREQAENPHLKGIAGVNDPGKKK